jgi:predicted flap endonuclease-1-like 5' DNA nuclease
MSEKEKIETKALNLNKAAVKPVTTAEFASKIDSSTLITSLQKDLLRAHDFAMSQERATTFVLSDFTLQLKAVVTQEGEKTMLALPTKQGEIDSSTMSTLNLSFKPIPLAVKPVTGTGLRPVEAIEGIGPVLGAKLRDVGINTVSDLALASSADLAPLKISSKKANEFISMAKLMVKSNIAGVEGVDEQVAELLVVAGKIDSKEKLAQTNPEELTRVLTSAIEAGQVKVPKSFRLSVDDSTKWVESAKTLVGRSQPVS